MCLPGTYLVLGLWSADVSSSLVSNPVGDAYLNIMELVSLAQIGH